MDPKDLVVGKDYVYWNKSVYQKEASPKRCRLIRVLRDLAQVFRYDLTVNAVQLVEIKRLKELPLEQGELPL